MRAIRRFTVRVTLPEPLAALHGLMLNLRWSWHGPTADLFASIDPAAFQASGGDPIAMLSALPSAKIAALAADEEFLARLDEAERDLRQYMSEPRWYASVAEESPDGHSGLSGVSGTGPASRDPPRSRTSRPSTASPRRCRSIRAAWASWPATT